MNSCRLGTAPHCICGSITPKVIPIKRQALTLSVIGVAFQVTHAKEIIVLKPANAVASKARHYRQWGIWGAVGGATAVLSGCVAMPADQSAYYQTAPAATYQTYPAAVGGSAVYPGATYTAPGYYDAAPGYYGAAPGYYSGPSVSLGIYGSDGRYRPQQPRYNDRRRDAPDFDRPSWNRPGMERPSRPGQGRPDTSGTTPPNRPGWGQPDMEQPSRPGQGRPDMSGTTPPNRPGWNRPGERPQGTVPGSNRPDRPAPSNAAPSAVPNTGGRPHSQAPHGDHDKP
jgi:hypothetical protein